MRIKMVAQYAGALVLLIGCLLRLSAQEACAVPTNAHPEFTAAIEAKSLGQNEAAIDHMEKCIREFKGSPAPYYLLGNWYWEGGKMAKARENWRLARSASPG